MGTAGMVSLWGHKHHPLLSPAHRAWAQERSTSASACILLLGTATTCSSRVPHHTVGLTHPMRWWHLPRGQSQGQR